MKKWLIHKFIVVGIVLAVVMTLNFLFLYSSPVDPVALQLSRTGVPPTAEVVAAIRAELGLDLPLWEQYLNWIKGIFHGDLGYSVAYGMPIAGLVKGAVPRTLALTLSSLLVGLLITLPLSILAFIKRNSFADYFIRFLSFIAQAMPTFWVGLLLIYVVCMRWHLLPVTVTGGFKGLILPSVALGIWFSGFYIRRIRAALLEEFRKPYIVGAKSRGISPYRILIGYLFPNSILGLISMLAITIGELLGGAVVAETIFGWRGMGLLMTESILLRDYPLMQVYVLWGCLTFIAVNLIADILQFWLDPVRRNKEAL